MSDSIKMKFTGFITIFSERAAKEEDYLIMWYTQLWFTKRVRRKIVSYRLDSTKGL